MKKTIVKAFAVMAVMVTAIALFGCNNVLGSAALRGVIESEEGQKNPVVSTEGMFGDFDEDATVDGVSLSNYATDLKYDWPDITEVGEDIWMEVGLTGTIKFYEDGYYVPFILSDDYQTNWGIDKREGDVCLTKVSPIYWNGGVWASVFKNGVEIKFNIRCDNVDFDTSGDNRPLVVAYDASSYVDSIYISESVYGDDTVYISGDFKWMSASDITDKYGNKYNYEDGYYLPVIFHESFRWSGYVEPPACFYDLELESDKQKVYLLYLGTDSSTTNYSVAFGIGGEYDYYYANISVICLNNSYPEQPGTDNPDLDDDDSLDEGDGVNQDEQTLMSVVEQIAIRLRDATGKFYIQSIQFR